MSSLEAGYQNKQLFYRDGGGLTAAMSDSCPLLCLPSNTQTSGSRCRARMRAQPPDGSFLFLQNLHVSHLKPPQEPHSPEPSPALILTVALVITPHAACRLAGAFTRWTVSQNRSLADTECTKHLCTKGHSWLKTNTLAGLSLGVRHNSQTRLCAGLIPLTVSEKHVN